jgi:hypothetical protein
MSDQGPDALQNAETIDEWITFDDGVRIVVPRYGSPEGTASGDVDLIKPVMIDPRDCPSSYKLGQSAA